MKIVAFIQKYPFRTIITLNLLMLSLIFGDFWIPYQHYVEEEYRSHYHNPVKNRSFRGGGGTSYVPYLECASGEHYRLGIMPEGLDKLQKGDEILITKTFFFRKIKTVEIKKSNESFKLSILHTKLAIGLLVFCFLVSVLNLFFCHSVLDFLLSIAALVTLILGLLYLIYY